MACARLIKELFSAFQFYKHSDYSCATIRIIHFSQHCVHTYDIFVKNVQTSQIIYFIKSLEQLCLLSMEAFSIESIIKQCFLRSALSHLSAHLSSISMTHKTFYKICMCVQPCMFHTSYFSLIIFSSISWKRWGRFSLTYIRPNTFTNHKPCISDYAIHNDMINSLHVLHRLIIGCN